MATPAELNLLLQSPAMAPPPGVTPNLVNPPVYWFKEWTLTAAVSITITTLFIMMRIYTKLFLIRNHAWEDCKPLVHPIRSILVLILGRFIFLGMGTAIRHFGWNFLPLEG